MARPLTCASALFLCLSSAAHAQPDPAGAPDRPTNKKLGETVTMPLTDANLQRRTIPPELTAILDDPYSLEGVRRCRDVIREVNSLNTVLGTDFDTPVELDRGKKRRDTVVGMAGDVIASLIPFRFLIREISGANKADQQYRAAIYAGVVRRGFLKGYGRSRHCKAPGAPARLPSAAEAAKREG